ncbi:response regulator transcription factor [Microvirga lotononidis]|uniref:Response regulator containing a CheY-like receiver domain and an HTH DNA-binding domain n=1 Tax=Microvirga lotononidis TaxID=864069 RepID=I4YTE9_9HYPH|nr:response regulator transcription factor [Microvirga lotononidis]EIM27241.1 response regulator containing a CheY-like receiver domain and an HTH DNA-binding domain [Microvirga lotononidis]WQO28587.1 response regulator transcription factor [Microvirga lotononidis]
MSLPNSPSEHPSEETGTTIVVLAGSLLFQDCLAEAMRPAFPGATILGASTPAELVHSHAMAKGPDLVVLSVDLQSGLKEKTASTIKAAVEHFPGTPIIVIGNCNDPSDVDNAISAGAQGVIPMTASLKIAIAAVQLVMAGETYYPRQVVPGTPTRTRASQPSAAGIEPLRAQFQPHNQVQRHPNLTVVGASTPPNAIDELHDSKANFTTREAEVLAALQKGYSNKWIAHRLGLSQNTVKAHIRHILRKLHATNRTEAVVLSQYLSPSGVAASTTRID